ncbi:acyl-CoA--sterol O-acyltransferase 1-like [Trifolium pratense]|uniref:Uncharacterized protein n=1 Tax=Trifolium pratense TaxID=57577 RepID=A0ACB0M080_TRIPR|nr:acyl-CoA--sterol O-acyltransferase 1-like [Trifolium pratense]CAJ2674157.1 unnamed protein product [Trifolium pratense]
MKGVINNFIIVWSVAITLFLYSYIIGKIVPNGRGRLVALFPPTLILLLLPIWQTDAHLIIYSTFCLSWLSTFKLLLFAFAKGPLSSNPPPSLFQFLLISSLPIKFQYKNQNQIKFKLTSLNKLELLVMSILLYFFVLPYEKKEGFRPLILTFIYFVHFYFGLELTFAISTTIARKILQLDLEKPFDRPYLSASPKEFWGKRWNVMASRILHPSVYKPMVNAFSHVIGRKWASIPAVVVTFIVSGLMHELIYYNLKRKNVTWKAWEPCWDSMSYFFIHGVFVALQIAYKKTFKPKQQLMPTIVSRTLTLAFVMTTTLTLFIPAFMRSVGR